MINIISGISAAGMAIGMAALIIILSVYNGFDSLVKQGLGNIEPDILITSSEGKFFTPSEEAFSWAYDQKEIKNMCSVIQETVFINYEGRQSIATAKGVDEIYMEESPLKKHIKRGSFSLHRGDIPLACIGSGLAWKLQANPDFVSKMRVYYPKKGSRISMANPMSAIKSISLRPSSIFATGTDADNSLLLLPANEMKRLLELENNNQVTGIEIRLTENCSAGTLRRIKKELEKKLGNGFLVKDRYEQNPSVYKMMKYEKLSIFIILMFVILIIALNIFSCLGMLIIEKKNDIVTLKSLGATNRNIKEIFIWEGWLISFVGAVAGLILGIGFVLLQMKTGMIKMPGGFMVNAYPVILKIQDIVLAFIGTTSLGYLISLLAASHTKDD